MTEYRVTAYWGANRTIEVDVPDYDTADAVRSRLDRNEADVPCTAFISAREVGPWGTVVTEAAGARNPEPTDEALEVVAAELAQAYREGHRHGSGRDQIKPWVDLPPALRNGYREQAREALAGVSGRHEAALRADLRETIRSETTEHLNRKRAEHALRELVAALDEPWSVVEAAADKAREVLSPPHDNAPEEPHDG